MLKPVTRNAAVTVRSAGERIAPINKIFACFQIRCENKLAKDPRIMIYSPCRVGIGHLLSERLPEHTLLFVKIQMAKVQLRACLRNQCYDADYETQTLPE